MKRICLTLLFILVWSTTYAADIKLQWDASPSQNVGGYKVYLGNQSGVYGSPINVGNVLSYTVTGLNDGTQYFIAATAYDTTGVSESGYSNEVQKTTDSVSVPIDDVGITTIFSQLDSGNGGLLLAQKITILKKSYLKSFSFYVDSPAGTLRFGLYDSTGKGGNPGNKLAESGTFAPVLGWNTEVAKTSTLLNPGTYWIAYNPSSNNLVFPVSPTGNYVYQNYSATSASLPVVFNTSLSSGVSEWSFYITLTDYEPILAPTNLLITQ